MLHVMSRIMIMCIVVVWGGLMPARAQQVESVTQDAPRHALVIGAGAYSAAARLANTRNDAELMAKTLQNLGFTVTKVLDPTFPTFNRSLLRYAQSLPQEAVSIVFFAGHGVQVGRKNFLLPIDADPLSSDDLPFLSVSMDSIFDMFRNRQTSASIFILDACRNNPFEDDTVRSAIGGGARGLAPATNAFQGSLVAYSTAPGKVAADGSGVNSPYTQALSDAMLRPGLPLESVFKLARTRVIGATDFEQVPWENSSLTRDVFLAPPLDETDTLSDAILRPTECDIQAGHPSDPERVHPGIDFFLLRPEPAIAACRADLAVDPGNPRHMTNLARALAKAGQAEEAIALNKQAIEQDYLGAYHNLGNHYKRGDGVARDMTKALELFTYAAERGHPEDAYNVGNIHWRGQAGDKDFDKAWTWFNRAASQDYPSAFDRLGLLTQRGEGTVQDDVAAVGYFRRGVELGDASAMVNLATAYRKGRGVDTDYELAFDLYLKAAQLRRRSAYTNLGEMYRKGMGREANPEEAFFWYSLAAQRGHGYSREQADALRGQLTKDQITDVEERVEDWLNTNFG